MIDTSVANEIQRQLGGQRFSIMAGANSYVCDSNSLTVKLPKAKYAIKFVKISLNPNDLYDVLFMKRDGSVAITVDNIYAEQLQEVFTACTGLYLSL